MAYTQTQLACTHTTKPERRREGESDNCGGSHLSRLLVAAVNMCIRWAACGSSWGTAGELLLSTATQSRTEPQQQMRRHMRGNRSPSDKPEEADRKDGIEG